MYTVPQVERLLRYYLDARFYFAGGTQRLRPDMMSVQPSASGQKRQAPTPLGMTPGDTRPWPFQEPRHARIPRDGKARARAIEELHVSLIDLEEGLRKLPDDDLALLYKYYIFCTHDLTDLCAEAGVSAPSTMQRRIRRVLSRLAHYMEHWAYDG